MQNRYNPDVLSCLANLSNDEVFTPPAVANRMLDLLPPDLWSNPQATFLDPACKTGVFLREIARRLIVGLATQIPDVQERVNHIMTRQLFGLPITELTSLLSRRSLYCSKRANGGPTGATPSAPPSPTNRETSATRPNNIPGNGDAAASAAPARRCTNAKRVAKRMPISSFIPSNRKIYSI